MSRGRGCRDGRRGNAAGACRSLGAPLLSSALSIFPYPSVAAGEKSPGPTLSGKGVAPPLSAGPFNLRHHRRRRRTQKKNRKSCPSLLLWPKSVITAHGKYRRRRILVLVLCLSGNFFGSCGHFPFIILPPFKASSCARMASSTQLTLRLAVLHPSGALGGFRDISLECVKAELVSLKYPFTTAGLVCSRRAPAIGSTSPPTDRYFERLIFLSLVF